MCCKSDKEKFLENYKGIFNAENAWRIYQAELANKERYKGATYNESYNKKLEREANNRARRR